MNPSRSVQALSYQTRSTMMFDPDPGLVLPLVKKIQLLFRFLSLP